jgi:hypothetical protein
MARRIQSSDLVSRVATVWRLQTALWAGASARTLGSMKNLHRIGAVFYVLWGVFHAYVGVLLLAKVRGGTSAALAVIGNALPPERIPKLDDPLVTGVIQHYAWNLLWFGLYAIVLAVFFNWRNSRVGYWFNLVVVSLTDIGFIAAIVLPGYITAAAGWTGPLFWVLAFIFTTLGLRQAKAS